MKISLNWLKEYVSIKLSPEALSHRLTMAGLEVEKIHSIGGDTVFELEITPNRPDCLNHLGLARETSAILNQTLKAPKIKALKKPSQKAKITIEDKKGCLRYIGAVVEDVQVKNAPVDICKKLQALDLRCVNNIVDITNFCLFETGQPMHAFDYDKLIGGKIIVRRAKKGEKIITIDDVERDLDPSIVVIADEKRPVAIAGVMGGKNTEVTSSTKNILLESAYFDPILIRRASRTLGLTSDSSYRFERGVDMDTVETSARRALELILKEAKGALSAYADIYPRKKAQAKKRIVLTKDKANNFLGTNNAFQKSKTILTKLGFKVASLKANAIKVVPPSFREDILRDVDVVEEVARVIGYDNLPVSLPLVKATSMSSSLKKKYRREISGMLSAQGLNEVITYTLLSKEALAKSKQEALSVIAVSNPLTKEQEVMRPTLLPGFLSLCVLNLNKGQKDIAVFETGKVYPPKGEQETLAILLTGKTHDDWRDLSKNEHDFYDLKGILDECLARLGIKGIRYAPLDDGIFEIGQGAQIYLGKDALGCLGQLNQEILAAFDIKNKKVYYGEIDLEKIYAGITPKEKYQPLPDFPAVVRDISIAVKEGVTYAQVKAIIQSRAGALLQDLRFSEQYLGDKIPEGYGGMIVSLTYQSRERTLTENDVSGVHQNICQALIDELGVIQR